MKPVHLQNSSDRNKDRSHIYIPFNTNNSCVRVYIVHYFCLLHKLLFLETFTWFHWLANKLSGVWYTLTYLHLHDILCSNPIGLWWGCYKWCHENNMVDDSFESDFNSFWLSKVTKDWLSIYNLLSAEVYYHSF